MPSKPVFYLALLACLLAALPRAAAKVELLNGESMQEKVLDSDDYWVVAAGSSNDALCGPLCGEVMEMLETLDSKLSHLIRFGWVDAHATMYDWNGEMGTVATVFNITGLPSIMLLPYGPKRSGESVMLQPASVAGIMQAGVKQMGKSLLGFLPDRTVRVGSQLTLARFFEDSRPQLARVLLLTSKKKTPNLYKRLALDYERRFIFGTAYGGTPDDILERFGVSEEELPVLLCSRVGDLDSTEESYDWERFEGKLTLPALHDFLDDYSAGVWNPQLKSHSDFVKQCASHSGVCIIGLLPRSQLRSSLDVLDAAAGRSYLTKVFESTGELESTTAIPLHFSWTVADTQAQFALDLGVNSFPTVVALNPRKKVYASFVGSFDAPTVRSWVIDVINMEHPLATLDRLPVLEKHTGKDEL